MERWKKSVMQKVVQELQIIRQVQAKAIKAQKQNFQMELEQVKRKLELFESKSKSLGHEIRVLKSLGQHPTHKVVLTKATVPISSNKRERKERLLED